MKSFYNFFRVLLPDLKALRQKIKPSNTNNGDGNIVLYMGCLTSNSLLAISAIVIAIQMITKYCKKLKYIRRIILVTDARGSIDGDGIQDITNKLKGEGIELVVVYVRLAALGLHLLILIEGLTLTTQSMATRKREKNFKRSLIET